MASQEKQPNKRELLETLLSEGMVLLHLNASAEGVDVPPGLREEDELGLNLSRRFPGALMIDEAGVQATLSFAGEPYSCALPFNAVYAMVSHDTGEGFFFPSEAPPTALTALAAALEEEEGAISELPSLPTVPAPRPALSLVQGGASEIAQARPRPEPLQSVAEETETEGDEPVAESSASAPPRLRLVK